MIVLDCSAFVRVLTLTEGEGDELADRLKGHTIAAPGHLDAEVISALIGLGLRRRGTTPKITEREMRRAFEYYELFPVRRYNILPFRDRIIELASNLSTYDAPYVALAELLDVPLLTSDRRIAKGYKATGGDATIELY